MLLGSDNTDGKIQIFLWLYTVQPLFYKVEPNWISNLSHQIPISLDLRYLIWTDTENQANLILLGQMPWSNPLHTNKYDNYRKQNSWNVHLKRR